METKHISLDSPRVHFNWGYHDGAAEARMNRERDVSDHFDKAYAAGYDRGVVDFVSGEDTSSSESAWEAWEADLVLHFR